MPDLRRDTRGRSVASRGDRQSDYPESLDGGAASRCGALCLLRRRGGPRTAPAPPLGTLNENRGELSEVCGDGSSRHELDVSSAG